MPNELAQSDHAKTQATLYWSMVRAQLAAKGKRKFRDDKLKEKEVLEQKLKDLEAIITQYDKDVDEAEDAYADCAMALAKHANKKDTDNKENKKEDNDGDDKMEECNEEEEQDQQRQDMQAALEAQRVANEELHMAYQQRMQQMHDSFQQQIALLQGGASAKDPKVEAAALITDDPPTIKQDQGKLGESQCCSRCSIS